MTITERIQKWWKNLPEKKKYLEIVTALLSIPVLATAIILNLNSLNRKDVTGPQQPTQNQQSAQNGGVTLVPAEVRNQTATPTTVSCRKEVGPVDVVYPKENQTVSDSPLCIDIAQKSADYCSVQWSFKLNDGQLSAFTNSQFCFSNLSSGPQKLQVRV